MLPVRCLIVCLGLPSLAVPQEPVASLVGNGSFEAQDEGGRVVGWQEFNWGPAGSAGSARTSEDGPRTGARCLAARADDERARPGVFTRLPLAAGRYALRFAAKAGTGRTVVVRCYLGDHYSPPYEVGDQWTCLEYRHRLATGRRHAEVALQYFGGAPGTAWFDDVELVALPAVTPMLAPDERPLGSQPRLVCLSGNLSHVQETAGDWVRRGFAGFLFAHVMDDWPEDVWAHDGDPGSVGEEDGLLREARDALRGCIGEGLTQNGLKIGLRSELPDPAEDAGYAELIRNFREAARFAAEAGFALIALDTEGAARQFEYSWPGYEDGQRSRVELAACLRERWRQVGEAIAQAHPTAELALLPEGSLYYGPLWMEVLAGLLEGTGAAGGTGGVHLFCEGAFSLRDPEAIQEHAELVRATTWVKLSGRARAEWAKRGKIALGAWPLGYFRAVRDQGGKLLGWTGRPESFGGKLVGPYADKSARYPLREFEMQLAAMRTFTDRYYWIYAHGASWWQISAQQAEAYSGKLHPFSRQSYTLATVPDIHRYYQVTAERNVVTFLPETQ